MTRRSRACSYYICSLVYSYCSRTVQSQGETCARGVNISALPVTAVVLDHSLDDVLVALAGNVDAEFDNDQTTQIHSAP